jgi:hypothetical protein
MPSTAANANVTLATVMPATISALQNTFLSSFKIIRAN